MEVKKLIVGLGNPGSKYAGTRHNVGFMVLDSLCPDFKVEKKFDAEICDFGGGNILMKPQTFMNLSGEAVKSFADFYKIVPENIWIIHDDIDIEFGEIRVREDGSSAGHKGIQSIIEKLGTEGFWRFRIGVKNEKLGKIETEDFVLQRFETDEERVLPEIINACATEIEGLLKSGNAPEGKVIKVNE